MNNEEYSTTSARILPPRKVSEPIYLKLEDLESIRELELEQRRIRAQEFQNRGW